MRILLSAYHCNPLDGSEPGLGWAVAVAAAQKHEVWLLLHGAYREQVTAAVASHPEWPIHAHFLSDAFPRHWERIGYLRWQREAARVATRLHGTVRFDVAHHLTLTNNWLDCGVAHVPGLPFVWGPVCGVPSPPLRYWRWLGARGISQELVRAALGGAGRLVFGKRMARRASVLVGANRQSVENLHGRWPGLIHPACVIDAGELPVPGCGGTCGTVPLGGASGPAATSGEAGAEGQPIRRAVFAGRLLPWKGLRLALAVLRRPTAAAWHLDVYGEGRDAPAVRRLVDRWGLDGRVRLHGRLDRDALLGELARADALLFPSLHECSPWVVGEAMALGCPVVGLDWGGIPTMLGAPGAGIAVPLRGDVVGGLAAALASLDGRTDPRLDLERGRLVELVDAWYRLAAERGA